MSKLTPQQETFAIEYIKTGNACEAYRIAYGHQGKDDKWIEVEAHRTKNHPKVSPRIEQLREEMAERNKVTIDEITQALREAATMAREDRKANDLTNAANSLAKLHGLIIDRSKTDNTVHVVVQKEGQKL